MDKRRQFEELLEKLRALRTERASFRQKYSDEFDALLREYKPWSKIEDHDKLRSKALKKLGVEGCHFAQRELVDRYSRLLQESNAEKHWVETQLERLAEHLTPRQGEEWTTIDTVWGSSYHTQGYGANAYAKGSAELRGLHYETLGLEVRVVTEKKEPPKHRPWHYVHTDNFRLDVKASQLDIEIAKRKPACSLRDFVKFCWSTGRNPRVYNPFLPHDLEKKLGIDYQGRDVSV